MQFAIDSSSETDARERIWFFPHKWWQATKGMTKEETATLMSQVEQDAENNNLDALKKYPFVYVGDPYKGSNAA
jgi:hypothetical protein